MNFKFWKTGAQPPKRRVRGPSGVPNAGRVVRPGVVARSQSVLQRAPAVGLTSRDGAMSGEALVRAYLPKLRKLSRQVAGTNTHIKKYVHLLKRNVVGPSGFGFDSMVVDESGSLDRDYNKQIEALWAEWSDVGNCDVTGEMSLRQLLSMALVAMARDGDCLIQVIDDYKDNKFGFALKLIEGDQLDHNYNEALPNGNRVSMGVEVNRYGRPQFYHVLLTHPGGPSGSDLRRQAIPADEIIHLRDPERIDAIRDIPWFTAVLTDLFQLGEFRNSELVQQRFAAQKLAVIEQDPQADVLEDVDPETGEIIDPGSFDEVLGEGGEIHHMPAGYRMKALEFQNSNGDARGFTGEVLRDAGSGLGVTKATFTGDYSDLSFSGGRQAGVEDQDQWQTLQKLMIEKVLNRVYRLWRVCVLTRQLLPMKCLVDQLYFKFSGRRWPYPNPYQDEKANEVALGSGTKSPQQIIRERGGDPEEVMAQLRQWQEKMGDVAPLPGAAAEADMELIEGKKDG